MLIKKSDYLTQYAYIARPRPEDENKFFPVGSGYDINTMLRIALLDDKTDVEVVQVEIENARGDVGHVRIPSEEVSAALERLRHLDGIARVTVEENPKGTLSSRAT